MQHDSRDSWAEALLWGATIALLLVMVGMSATFYFNWMAPVHH
jgi:hypothetical protein